MCPYVCPSLIPSSLQSGHSLNKGGSKGTCLFIPWFACQLADSITHVSLTPPAEQSSQGSSLQLLLTPAVSIILAKTFSDTNKI